MKTLRNIIGGLALIAGLSGCECVHPEYDTKIVKANGTEIEYFEQMSMPYDRAIIRVTPKGGKISTQYVDLKLDGSLDEIIISKQRGHPETLWIETTKYNIKNKEFKELFEQAQLQFDKYKQELKEAKIREVISIIKNE